MHNYVTIVGLLSLLTTASALSCTSCLNKACPKIDCPGSKVMSPCGCCYECAKQTNETCGGPFYIGGKCDKGLSCFISVNPGSRIQSDWGICKKIADCSNTICPVQYRPKCPDDSVLMEGFISPGACCPDPGRCECRPQQCKEILCRPGLEPHLVVKGTGVPGLCCDVFECRAKNDLCAEVKCAPVPKVTCPSDSSKVAGQRSGNGCCELQPRCQCDADKCPAVNCPVGNVPKRVSRGNDKPGTCCDTYQCVNATTLASCEIDGRFLRHGEKYSLDACHTCSCVDGVRYCATKKCPKLKCVKQYTPPGECCPKCKITIRGRPTTVAPTRLCFGNGEFRGPGEWWKEDACTTCTCEDGVERCIAQSCQINCANPRTVEGQCCPVCDAPTIIEVPSIDCPSMEGCRIKCDRYALGRDGCQKCECAGDDSNCPELHCDLKCGFGYVTDANGCATCACRAKRCRAMGKCEKDCVFGYRRDHNGCERCRCNKCPEVPKCEHHCKHDRKTDLLGCPKCMCHGSPPPQHSDNICHDELKRKRESGESWDDGKGRKCACFDGLIYCSALKCPALTCDTPTIVTSSLCPVCQGDDPVTEVPNLTCREADLNQGQTSNYQDAGKCVCAGNLVMCEDKLCPPTPCEAPEFVKGSKCAVCKGIESNATGSGKQCYDRLGKRHLHGETWQRNPCASCRCADGTITCHASRCSAPSNYKISVTIKGECCPRLLETPKTCEYNGLTYQSGGSFKHTDGCNTCYCFNGAVECTLVKCLPADDLIWDVAREIPEEPVTSRRWFPFAIGGAAVVLFLLLMAGMVVIMCRRGRCSIQRSLQTKYTSGVPTIDQK